MPHLSLPPAPPILHSLLPLVLLILPGEAGPDAALGRSSLTQPEANHEPDVTLEAGYPGWEAPTFKRAASEPQGRFLYYRKTPKVDKYRSAVHELYMRPYNYAYLTHHAVAVLTSPDDAVSGVLHFYQVAGPTSPVHVVGNVTGLSPGLHGFHIHQLGDLSGGCKSTAGHFNPYQVTHGAPFDQYRHAGDLGNILANKAGLAQVDITDRLISLNGINSILGRGLVLHAGEDDLGRGGDDGSLKTGNAGGRVACAVIGHAADAV